MHHSMWTINSPIRAICPWQQWFQLSSSCFWTSPSLDGLYFYNRTTRSWLGTGSFYLATPFYTCSQLLNVDIVMISFCIFDKLLRKWRSHCSDHCVNPLQQFPRNKSVTSWQLPRVSYSFIHSGMQRVSSARRRHHSPEWTILSHVICFIQGEVQWFRSCWVVFIHVVRGHPSGILQFSKEEAVSILACIQCNVCLQVEGRVVMLTDIQVGCRSQAGL